MLYPELEAIIEREKDKRNRGANPLQRKDNFLATLIQITQDPTGGSVPRIELIIEEKELSNLSRLEVVITRPVKDKRIGVMGSFWKEKVITRHQYFISGIGKLYAPGDRLSAHWRNGRVKKCPGHSTKSTKLSTK